MTEHYALLSIPVMKVRFSVKKLTTPLHEQYNIQ